MKTSQLFSFAHQFYKNEAQTSTTIPGILFYADLAILNHRLVQVLVFAKKPPRKIFKNIIHKANVFFMQRISK